MNMKVLLSIIILAALILSLTYIPKERKNEENVTTTVKPEKYCLSDEDCVPAQCCHPTDCVNKAYRPNCKGIICTMECRPGTMDCGQGYCACVENECKAIIK